MRGLAGCGQAGSADHETLQAFQGEERVKNAAMVIVMEPGNPDVILLQRLVPGHVQVDGLRLYLRVEDEMKCFRFYRTHSRSWSQSWCWSGAWHIGTPITHAFRNMSWENWVPMSMDCSFIWEMQ